MKTCPMTYLDRKASQFFVEIMFLFVLNQNEFEIWEFWKKFIQTFLSFM